eukprot:Hpha_TRINITY_DN16234_c1_g3::TRINITY_DN16234_c1_g3_i1::g.13417::m.13417
MPPKPGAKEKRRLQKLQEMQLKESAAACDEGEEVLLKVREDKPLPTNMPHYQSAVKCFNRAVENNPDSQRAFVLRGRCFKAMQEWEKSVGDFSKAVELLQGSETPGHQQMLLPEALRGRAYCYEQLGQLDEAIDDYTSLIELQPDDDHAYNMRGNARSRKRPRGLRLKNVEFQQVVSDLTRAIDLNDCNYHALAGRGSAYFDRQEYRKAIADYSRAVFLKDDYHYMLLRRAVAYYELVLQERAEDSEKASEKKVRNTAGKTQEQVWEEEYWEEEAAARRHEQQEEFMQQALKDLESYMKHTGGEQGQQDVEALIQRGMVQRLMNDLEAAKQSFKKAKDIAKEIAPEFITLIEKQTELVKRLIKQQQERDAGAERKK